MEPTSNGHLRAHRIQKTFIENACTSRKSHIKHDGHLDSFHSRTIPNQTLDDYAHNTIFYAFQGHKTKGAG